MGKFNPKSNNIYQQLPGAVGGGEFGSPVAFDGQVYFGGVGATLRAFQFVDGKLQAALASQSSNTFGYPGTTPSVSADGNANGIAWAIDDGNSTAVLFAYDASNVSKMLYNSNQAPDGRDSVGPSNKFITPTIANGKVYVATADGVAVFGLLPTVVGEQPVVNHPPRSTGRGSWSTGRNSAGVASTATGMISRPTCSGPASPPAAPPLASGPPTSPTSSVLLGRSSTCRRATMPRLRCWAPPSAGNQLRRTFTVTPQTGRGRVSSSRSARIRAIAEAVRRGVDALDRLSRYAQRQKTGRAVPRLRVHVHAGSHQDGPQPHPAQGC